MTSPDIANDSVLAHVVDVHCHPVESSIDPHVMDTLPITICAMATTASDQQKVRDLAERWPDKVIPAFGYHPWFTHTIALTPPSSTEDHYRTLFLPPSAPQSAQDAFTRLLPSLPAPHIFSDLLATLRTNLTAFPNAMLGEVGVDRAARVPFPASSDSSPQPCCTSDEDSGAASELVSYHRRELSPFITPLSHQLTILEAQLAIAVELRRNTSIHSVKAPQLTRELLDRMASTHGAAWRRISVDLHSCGLSPQVWIEIEKRHPNVFLSLSTAINSRSANHRALIAACAPSRLLVESDFCNVRFCTTRTWDMVRIVAEVKGWRIEQDWEEEDENADEDKWGVVRRLEQNWLRFVKGGHKQVAKASRKNRKTKWDEWGDSETEDDGKM